MVEKNLQTELVLELVFSVGGVIEEKVILNKTIPLYLRKLNCFLASVIRDTNEVLEEVKLVPYVAGKSSEWAEAKAYFLKEKSKGEKSCPQYYNKGCYYYGFCLNNYGILILGRKKQFDPIFLQELKPVTDHLGKSLSQAMQIEKREKAEFALKASEEKLSSILNAMDDMVFVLDENNCFTSYYASEERLYIPPEEFLGRTLMEVMPEYVYQPFLDVLPNVRNGKATEFEYLINEGNREFWFSVKLSPLYNNGLYAGLTAVSRDITKRKRVEKDLIAAKEKAEEADRLKSAFLANMSHEIRTPMNGILGFVNLLNNPNLSSSQIEQYSSIINQSGERLLSTINDIIDISKIEAGQVVISKTEVSILKEMEEMYAFFLREANQKGLSLSFESPNSPDLKVKTDSHKLNGVLTNLIKNAIKFTEKGKIEIGYVVEKGYVEFYVKDTGIGIAEERIQAIFNRFEQADIEDVDVYEGSGLGLAISKAYIEMLGGEISVKSKMGVGSEFTFTIPLIQPENQMVKKTKPFESGDSALLLNLNVLIAEDELVSAKYLETVFKNSFKKLTVVNDGIEAVEFCKLNTDVDLILMDIKMPRMNGYDACAAIRKFNSEVLIIAQTGYAMTGDREKALKVGCDDYISKPIDKSLLLKKINRLTNR